MTAEKAKVTVKEKVDKPQLSLKDKIVNKVKSIFKKK